MAEGIEIGEPEKEEIDLGFLDFLDQKNWIKPKTKEVLLGLAQGARQVRIAETNGVSKQAINKKIKKLRGLAQYLVQEYQAGKKAQADPDPEGQPVPIWDESGQGGFDFWGGAE